MQTSPHSPLFFWIPFVEMMKLFLAPLSPPGTWESHILPQSPTGYLTPPRHWHLHPNLLPEQASLSRRNVNLRYHSTLESVLLSSRDSALAVSTQQSGKANVSIFQNFFFKPLKWISGHLKVKLIIWGLPDYINFILTNDMYVICHLCPCTCIFDILFVQQHRANNIASF